MKISIEFYASLMKYLPPGKSRFRRDIKVEDGMKLNPLIGKYNISAEEAHLVSLMVNLSVLKIVMIGF